jgi:hypothetical protein
MMKSESEPLSFKYKINPICGECQFFHPYSDGTSGLCKTSANFRRSVQSRQHCTVPSTRGVFAFRQRSTGTTCGLMIRCRNPACGKYFELIARNQRFCSDSCRIQFYNEIALQKYRERAMRDNG